MNIQDLRTKSSDQLKTHLLDLRREQFNLRMQKGTGQLTQTHQMVRVRREIAKVKMLLGANS